jgi:methylmalonyl-CoA/ethylmalonyl-CoA epimerase
VILGIDHVGLATDDPAGVGRVLSALGLLRADAGTAGAYGVACEFWAYPEAAQPAIELVSPDVHPSAVDSRLAAEGPGLYHVAFHVDDLVADMDRLRRDGFRLLDREPCAGARPGMRVAFLYAPRPAGLLVELVEYRTHKGGSSAGIDMATAGDPAA